MATISVDRLCKQWAETLAVDNVSFDAPAGNFTVLLGPSGCGKSTTLRLIAGLEDASAGRISIGGEVITHLPPARRNLSMVFQSYALFPHLSVAENILFGLKVRRVPAAERKQKLRKTAELLGLAELLNRRPAQLSGGQQQRVALGRAIIAERQVCLMDEPLSNLDAKLRHEMRLEIRALQQKLGISMIYVTHDQAEAMSMADRVIVLRDGRIEQDAPPEDIYQKPATAFVAGFIGTPPMNMVGLADHEDGAILNGNERLLVYRGGATGLRLGIRPEDIRVADPGVVSAEVLGVEYLGADSIMDCRLGGDKVAVRTHGRVRYQTGSRVGLTWAPQAVHFFEHPSGRRRDDISLDESARAALADQ